MQKAMKVTMKAEKRNEAGEHTGSTFDSFLDEEGIREQVEVVAVKRVLAWRIGKRWDRKSGDRSTGENIG
jgi:hypothetical protein